MPRSVLNLKVIRKITFLKRFEKKRTVDIIDRSLSNPLSCSQSKTALRQTVCVFVFWFSGERRLVIKQTILAHGVG